MDEVNDPDPRRVVQRLGGCPGRTAAGRLDAPPGFRIHSFQSSLERQYSRKTSEILLHADLGTQDISAQVQCLLLFVNL